MKFWKSFFCIASVALSVSGCISTKNTIKNIDNDVKTPKLIKGDLFEVTLVSTNKKYGYDKDYPVNVGFTSLVEGDLNVKRFLNALAGPNGEAISYVKAESCCPFTSMKSEIGAGMLDVYTITYPGLSKPISLYFNIYERGELAAPVGFTLKKI